MQQGRTRSDVPVYLPADSAIPVPGIPAVHSVTRPLISDTTLMQRERKRGIPGWVWSIATGLVLAIIAVLLAIIGWGLDRVAGRLGGDPPAAAPDRLRARGVRVGVAPAGVGR
jgi:hypothetical protein